MTVLSEFNAQDHSAKVSLGNPGQNCFLLDKVCLSEKHIQSSEPNDDSFSLPDDEPCIEYSVRDSSR